MAAEVKRMRNGVNPQMDEGIKGYRRFSFSDFTLILNENFVQFSDILYQVLSGLSRGNIDPRVVEPFSSGRGVVYLTHVGEKGGLVIRPYRHGGIFGKVLKGLFLTPRRFLSELAITEAAKNTKVTLLDPVCVAYRKAGWGVNGFWVSRQILDGISLYEWMQTFSPSISFVERIAQTVARMHLNGIGHADLTVQNILVVRSSDSPPIISIIDFDSAFKRSVLSLRERMRQLRRLDRSLLKWIPEGSPWRSPWVRLRFAVAYCRLTPEIWPLLEEYIRHFSWYERWYRFGWNFQRVFR